MLLSRKIYTKKSRNSRNDDANTAFIIKNLWKKGIPWPTKQDFSEDSENDVETKHSINMG